MTALDCKASTREKRSWRARAIYRRSRESVRGRLLEKVGETARPKGSINSRSTLRRMIDFVMVRASVHSEARREAGKVEKKVIHPLAPAPAISAGTHVRPEHVCHM